MSRRLLKGISFFSIREDLNIFHVSGKMRHREENFLLLYNYECKTSRNIKTLGKWNSHQKSSLIHEQLLQKIMFNHFFF
jgi:hypothetical protein